MESFCFLNFCSFSIQLQHFYMLLLFSMFHAWFSLEKDITGLFSPSPFFPDVFFWCEHFWTSHFQYFQVLLTEAYYNGFILSFCLTAYSGNPVRFFHPQIPPFRPSFSVEDSAGHRRHGGHWCLRSANSFQGATGEGAKLAAQRMETFGFGTGCCAFFFVVGCDVFGAMLILTFKKPSQFFQQNSTTKVKHNSNNGAFLQLLTGQVGLLRRPGAATGGQGGRAAASRPRAVQRAAVAWQGTKTP